MAAPVATKTWKHYNSSCPVGSGPAELPVHSATGYDPEVRKMLFDIKSAMIAAPGAWTILSSCGWNGAAFEFGAVDKWVDASWVGWEQAGSEYGWMVMRNNAISVAGNGFQICFSLSNPSTMILNIYVSFSEGFTGGSVTARPTATDEVLYSYTYWTAASNVNRGASIFKTSDGQCTRVYLSFSGTLAKTLLFERPRPGYSSDWEYPYIMGGPAGYRALYSTMTTVGASNFAAGEFSTIEAPVVFRCTTESYGGGPIGSWLRFDSADADGKWIATEVGLAHVEGPTPYGYLGRFQDLWLVSDNLATGDFFPTGGTREFVVMDNVLQPNDGSVPTID